MTRLPILVLLAACLLSAIPGAPRAELPPTAYEAMRAKAAYVMVLEVQQVQAAAARVNGQMRKVSVTVRARVLSVIRGSDLKLGDMVTIAYTIVRPLQRGWVGPSPVPMLRRGTRVLAWLNRDKAGYAPAAGGRSFATLR